MGQFCRYRCSTLLGCNNGGRGVRKCIGTRKQLFSVFCYFLPYPCVILETQELFPRTYFTHKTTHAYLSLLMDCWNIQENLESDLKWAGVCCFVLLYRYWDIVTVPVSFLFRGPGVAGSSPFTLTTSLFTLVPSSSSSNGSTTTMLITVTRGLCPGSSVVCSSPKFVQPHW